MSTYLLYIVIFILFYKQTSYPMTRLDFLELRLFLRATVNGNWATGVETATFGRVERTGDITLEDSATVLEIGMLHWNWGKILIA